jgi:hypothetical protein
VIFQSWLRAGRAATRRVINLITAMPDDVMTDVTS